MPLTASYGGFLALAGMAAGRQLFLAPEQDINLPRGINAESPLTWLGANSPWTSGPNVHSISTEVPDNCYVDAAAYVARHGSRYPDPGAYDEWIEMESRFSLDGYTAREELAFLPTWKPLLTNPDAQISMLSPTGNKEAMDMGYQLRTQYPQLYNDGEEFTVWANNVTRVLQTATAFMHGFLGARAPALGRIMAVSSKDIPAAIGNSLAPSDMCPNFEDEAGGEYTEIWNSIWQPRVRDRLQELIDGNLTLTLSDVNLMPYLCGFESQITGRLSPFCDIFTDEELRMYQYSNDLRYYYGMGPGTDLPSKMMTPFLNSLVDLLAQGPGVEGVGPDGTSAFRVPNLLVSFLNDGQLIELITASGVVDEEGPLSATEIDDDRVWVGSRFVTMRGTIAFERLNCAMPPKNDGTTMPIPALQMASASLAGGPSKNTTYLRIRLNDQVYPVPSCKGGPGFTCALDEYAAYVKAKYEAEGDWIANCNATELDSPAVIRGASFFTDLAQQHVAEFIPE